MKLSVNRRFCLLCCVIIIDQAFLKGHLSFENIALSSMYIEMAEVSFSKEIPVRFKEEPSMVLDFWVDV